MVDSVLAVKISVQKNEDSHAIETYNDKANAADVQNVVWTMTTVHEWMDLHIQMLI